MNIRIDISEAQARQIIADYMADKLGRSVVEKAKIRIEVKSKQNYKAEWECAAFRAVYEELDA